MALISTRRTLLKTMGLTSLGLLAVACTPQSPPAPAAATSSPAALSGSTAAVQTAPTSVPASATTQASGALRLPTYVPAPGVAPDLPGTPAGVEPAYSRYPGTLFKSVTRTPATGGQITSLVYTLGAAPSPMEQNAAWQELNKQLGTTLNISLVSQADYAAKFSTVVAGGSLPDLLFLSTGTTLQRLPDFLKAQCADLTPHLSGDAIKDYPNLANYPAHTWRGTVFNNAIYAVPVPTSRFGFEMLMRQDMLERVGAAQPQNADDFKRTLQALTKPDANQWGIVGGSTGGTYFGAAFLGLGWFPQVFGAPNNWSVDASGKFTKDLETEHFKAAVGYVRDLVAAGVFHPNSANYNQASGGADFLGGRFAFEPATWSALGFFWSMAATLNPMPQFRRVRPFAADGGKPQYYFGAGNFGVTLLKKAGSERVKELLRVLNYLAAPFGSEEFQLLRFGVRDVDFSLDSRGTPVLTDTGRKDLTNGTAAWANITNAQQFIAYNPTNSEQYAQLTHDDDILTVSVGIDDPSVGLYSPTNGDKFASLLQTVNDGVIGVILNRAPMSDFDRIVQDWRQQGGDQIRTELQQAYAGAKP